MQAVLIILCLLIAPLSLELTASEQRIQLQAPLTTNVYASEKLNEHCIAIQAQFDIPEHIADKIGVGAFIKDDDGNWFQLAYSGSIVAGHNHVHFPLDSSSPWQGEPHQRFFDAYQKSLAYEFGLYFWSEHALNDDIIIKEIRALTDDKTTSTKSAARQFRIYNCTWDAAQEDAIHIQTGQRWELRCAVDPMPSNPYKLDDFELQLQLYDEKRQRTLTFNGFYAQDMQFTDGGNKEIATVQGQAYFAARFRPMRAGSYKPTIIASWKQHESATVTRMCRLPVINVQGEDWDPYVRVDEKDPRFFSYGAQHKQFHWPIGINIRSVTDPRGTKRTRSKPTPDRGLLAYKAYIDRCARAGATNAEIWMSSWNLALEWIDEWPGFHGIGKYHEANAARIDELLDYAWERNIRIILVINNHGQASTGADAEWKHSPYNKTNGGITHRAAEMFTHKDCIKMQEQHRKYIIARYADHPAILCWKLWTEMNLTRGSRKGLQTWHKQAFDSFHALDFYYRHPCATHWSGDYNVPDRELVKMKEMDVIAIDAYHQRRFLPQLLYYSTLHDHRGLSRFNKPVVVTEFGGNWDACPLPQLHAEHSSGFWAALMSGHASSPHLWWFEWVDQENLWLPFRAMNNYLQGEDLRHSKARSVNLDVRQANDQSAGQMIWSRAWARPGHILGYCLDYDWGNEGRAHPLHQDLNIVISKNAKAGKIVLEWWDANLGQIIKHEVIDHQQGELRLQVPDFRRHLAFKLKRLEQSSTEEAGL